MMNLKNRILFLFRSLKKYGLRGVVDLLLDLDMRLKKSFSRRNELLGTMRRSDPERGLTLVGEFRGGGSLSKVMRDLAKQLKKAGSPYQTLDKTKESPVPPCEYDGILTPTDGFCANKYTKILAMQGDFPSIDRRCDKYAIHFWEFEDGFKEFMPDVYKERNVLAFSDFNREVFRKELPGSINVRKVLYPFQFDSRAMVPKPVVRENMGIGIDDFVVFFSFSFGTSAYRKNPEGVVRAFAKSLGREKDAKIVFKTSCSERCAKQYDKLRGLVSGLGLGEKVVFVNEYISQDALVSLTNACDAYVSLHRGEGFGLGIVEAMYLGLPVVVSDYSAVREFCNKDNSIPISYRRIVPDSEAIDHVGYKNVKTWIEPDEDEAAQALRRLYDDENLRKELGLNAQRFVKEYFSIQNFKDSIDRFLDD